MTLSTLTQRNEYLGTGALATFPYTFKILEDSDLEVYVAGVLKALNTHYTVTGEGVATGGNVVFEAAYIPAAAEEIIILRAMPQTQETDFAEGSKLPAETLEETLDKLTMEVQDLKEKLERALSFPTTSLYRNRPVPDPVSGGLLKWKSDLSALENYVAAFPGGSPGDNFDWGTGPPIAGTYAKPWIRFNSDPGAGGPAGWVLTVAGTPGTWGEFAFVNFWDGGSVPSFTAIAIGNNLDAVYDAQKGDLIIAETKTLSVPRSTAAEEWEMGVALVNTLEKIGTASTDVKQCGGSFEPRIGANNTRDWIDSLAQVGLFTTNNVQPGASGAVAAMNGIVVSADIAAMAIGTRYGIRILDPSIYGTATVDELFGLYIGDHIKGATVNFGIYNKNSPIWTRNDIPNLAALYVTSNPTDGAGTNVGIDVQAVATTTGANYALYVQARNAANNYAIIVPAGAGKVGIGTDAPGRPLDVVNNTTGATNDLLGWALEAAGGMLGLNTVDKMVYLKLNSDNTWGWRILNHAGDVLMEISNAGVIKIPSLAGAGSRTVTADANGVLSAP